MLKENDVSRSVPDYAAIVPSAELESVMVQSHHDYGDYCSDYTAVHNVVQPKMRTLSRTERLRELCLNAGFMYRLPYFECGDFDNMSSYPLLGCGGFGQVYEAPLKQELCAIKVMSIHDEIAEISAIAELSALMSIQENPNPGLLAIKGFGVKPGCDHALSNDGFVQFPQLWIATELHKLGSLADYLSAASSAGAKAVAQQTAFCPQALYALCVQLLDTLEHFHHHTSRVHLDLKPENIFVSNEGKLVIGDFGLSAKLEQLRSPPFTRIGTPGYGGPELQFVVGDPIEDSSDIYSIAVVMSQILSLGEPERLATPREAFHRAFDNLYDVIVDVCDYGGTKDETRSTMDYMMRCASRIMPFPVHLCTSTQSLLRDMMCWNPDSRPFAYEAARRLRRIAEENWPGWVPEAFTLDGKEWQKLLHLSSN